MLHKSLTHERHRRRQLELDVFDAQQLAFHDGLTLLPNRSFFQQRLGRALGAEAGGRSLAVVYLDLDNFKSINDTYGHAVGDAVLRVVALRLTRTVRSGDMVSRLGGDEFACLLADMLGRDQLSHLACKLLDAVAEPIQLDQVSLTVRPSIGIALCPADGVTVDSLLQAAYAAMYRAKRHKSGYGFFDQDVPAQAEEFV
ncbi:MAG: GGDEF domain-containing protein [Burkholderiaceae bacterium]